MLDTNEVPHLLGETKNKVNPNMKIYVESLMSYR